MKVAVRRSEHQWLVYRIFLNDIGALEMALVYQRSQRNGNDVKILRMTSTQWGWRFWTDVSMPIWCWLDVKLCCWWRFGPMDIVLSRAASRFLLPSPRLIDLERNRIVWMLMIKWNFRFQRIFQIYKIWQLKLIFFIIQIQ